MRDKSHPCIRTPNASSSQAVQVAGVYDKIVPAIEEAGGVVVAYENCTGTKKLCNLVDENDDPISAIAKRYMAIPCSIMSPNKERENVLQEMIKEYKADGVIDVVLQACHTYNVENC